MFWWFNLLFLGSAWIVLNIIQLVAEGNPVLDALTPDPRALILVAFILFHGRAYFLGTHRLLKDRGLEFLLASPIRPLAVMTGRAAFIVYEHLVSVVSIFATLVGFWTLSGLWVTYGGGSAYYDFYIPPEMYLGFLGMGIGSAFTGIAAAILVSRSRWFVLVMGPMFGLAVLAAGYETWWEIYVYSGALIAYGLIMFYLSTPFLLSSWNKRLAEDFSASITVKWSDRLWRTLPLRGLLGAKAHSVFLKEVLIANRNRENVGAWITLVVAIGGSYYFGTSFAQEELAPYQYLIFPALVGLSLYITAILEYGLASLSSLGREGKALWVTRSAPLRGTTFMTGRAAFAMREYPLMILGVGVILPLLGGAGWKGVLFATIGGTSMALAFTGLGLWWSTRYPNFDASVRGNPDTRTSYIFMIACLGLGYVMAGIPFSIYINVGWLPSLVAILGGLVLGAAVFAFGFWRGARGYERSEVS